MLDHRLLSSSFFMVSYLESYKVIPKKELLRSLWVYSLNHKALNPTPVHLNFN